MMSLLNWTHNNNNKNRKFNTVSNCLYYFCRHVIITIPPNLCNFSSHYSCSECTIGKISKTIRIKASWRITRVLYSTIEARLKDWIIGSLSLSGCWSILPMQIKAASTLLFQTLISSRHWAWEWSSIDLTILQQLSSSHIHSNSNSSESWRKEW